MALVQHNYSNGASVDTTVRVGAGGGSRLAQIQARFQQKQMLEKEQKLLRLYESQQQRAFQCVAGRNSAAGSDSSVTSGASVASVGRVRRLFQDRRGRPDGAGWDRSHLLQPLDGGTKPKQQQQQGIPAGSKTGATRVSSLDRSHNGVHKSNLRRSKSHARGTPPADIEVNSSYRKHIAEDFNNSFKKLDRTEDFGSSKKQIRTEDFNSGSKKHSRIEDFNGSYRIEQSKNKYEDDEDDYDNDNFQLNDNQTFTIIDDKSQEFFDKYQQRDFENNELLSASPPPQFYDDQDDDELDDSFVFKKLPNVGGPLTEDKFKTYTANKNKDMNKKKTTAPAAAAAGQGKTGATRRQTEASVPKPAARTAAKKLEAKTNSPAAAQRTGKTVAVTRSSPNTSTMSKGPVKQRVSTSSTSSRQRPLTSGAKMVEPPSVASEDLVTCKVCNRRFAPDRIAVHESICARSGQKKRKTYDATKHRVMGTEAEAYVKKMGKQISKKPEAKRPDWRRKHEEFILTIRAAKEAQAHVAAGGKLSDLPPPPPLDTSDYIQCPHCNRRFNETAAERHIPKCATMIHNKPKPGAGPGPARGSNSKRR